ncbi:E3 ubiquitin/ISG15 ligase TRIM25-like [Pyxicephalus adspersus]|uniref:Uncharacterized protein n=1 Tax=Pyxicephalus adspersus TaxID=30357 RepID=A0AAV2ZV54_PYXAD|nr:TPA: hypothetical protein GDO54_003250 [Pyxicephalus adspersus]
MAVADLREELNCSICLNVFEDPVMLKCGHNFCSTCITNVLRAQEGSGVYSCPQCRMQFQEQPALQRNIVLRNIIAHFQSTHSKEEPTGILCTYCINFSAPAVKTCINCEASLCEGHVKVHNKSSEHVLIEPTSCLENRKCSMHKKILEYYCCKDSICICVSCRLDGIHKGHQVKTVQDAFEQKRGELKNVLEDLSSQKEEATNKIQTLKDEKDKEMKNAANLHKTILDLFTNIKKKLNTLEKQVLKEVCRQKAETSKSATELIQNLEVNIDKISKKIIKLEKIYSLVDPITFLQDRDDENHSKEEDRKSLEKKTRKEMEYLHEGMIYIQLCKGLCHIVNQVKLDVLQAGSDVVLDDDTAGNSLHISEDFKTVSSTKIPNSYPMILKRFTFNQVLSKNIFSFGQHYWEVETSKEGNWRIGVAYASIDTKKNQSALGNNKKSWCLRRFNDHYSVMHDDNVLSLTHASSCNSFGVYLDYEAGRLAFYELGDPITYLYTFNTTFTEPVHAAFLVSASSLKVMSMTC